MPVSDMEKTYRAYLPENHNVAAWLCQELFAQHTVARSGCNYIVVAGINA